MSRKTRHVQSCTLNNNTKCNVSHVAFPQSFFTLFYMFNSKTCIPLRAVPVAASKPSEKCDFVCNFDYNGGFNKLSGDYILRETLLRPITSKRYIKKIIIPPAVRKRKIVGTNLFNREQIVVAANVKFLSLLRVFLSSQNPSPLKGQCFQFVYSVSICYYFFFSSLISQCYVMNL